jgi:hypothetical protein
MLQRRLAMDNTKYTLGTDLYQGNTIHSWQALAEWAGFVYLRASIGSLMDKRFLEYARLAQAAGMAVGAYHELWPSQNIGAQMSWLKQQLLSAYDVKFSLPVAIIYEPQPVVVAGIKTMTLPKPEELYAAMALSPAGAIVGTNLSGLYQLKADFIHAHKYWIAHYLADQAKYGEAGVDDVLKVLNRDYNIAAQQVLFIQTASKLKYPAGISPDKEADIDRAVAWQFIPSPVPEPIKTIRQVTVTYSDGSVTVLK